MAGSVLERPGKTARLLGDGSQFLLWKKNLCLVSWGLNNFLQGEVGLSGDVLGEE